MNRIGYLAVRMSVAFSAAQMALAEPNWTKNGDCRSCHNTDTTMAMQVSGFYTRANPNEHGRQKVFWARPGETKSLSVEVRDLAASDHYGVVLKKLGNSTGVQAGQVLQVDPDCSWAQWWSGVNGFYTDPPMIDDPVMHYLWPGGPSLFEYNLVVSAACPADYYDLAFGVGGAPEHGTQFFYGEEHFYLYVGSDPPPMVVSADFDCDGDVDQDDFGVLQRCYAGSDTSSEAGCTDVDLDVDGDVDGLDFDVFQQCANGPNLPPKEGCPN